MSDAASAEHRGLWGRAFRPFFLGAAVHATLVVPVWTGIWLGRIPVPGWLTPVWWHGHEMIFGTVAAAVAGFLLTASPVWTGRRALSGKPLAALVALWLAGRVSLVAAGVLPLWLVALVDVAFLPAVAGVLSRTVWGTGQRANQGIVGIVLVLALANAAMHGEALGLVSGAAGRALGFAVHGIVVLLLVIGGRITPAFTANAFRRDGIQREIRSAPALSAIAIGAAGAFACVGLVAPRTPATGALATLAGVAAAARLAGWQPWHTRADPLLWSLHVGAAWMALGLLLVGASDLGAAIPASAGVHALTAGAMGATMLAVMTRVGLGHTGRPLVLPPGVVGCHVLVSLGALARVLAPVVPEAYQSLLLAGGLAWASAFALFGLRYGPLLIGTRADGKPG